MQNKYKFLKSYIWLIPFLSFIGGYLGAHILFSSPRVEVPNLVGSSITGAIRQVSDKHLNIRILTEKEDSDLLPGTVIHQKPTAHQKVKPYHAVYVILSKKPSRKKTANFLGKDRTKAQKELERESSPYKIFSIPSSQKSGIIIGQYPQPEHELKGPLKLYAAQHQKQHFVFPRLIGKQLGAVKEFFDTHDIPLHVNTTRNSCTDTMFIKEQRPLPGTLISLEEPPHVQLLV